MAHDDAPQPNRPQDTPPARPAPLSGDELALRRRVSDFEREEVADVLRESAAEGRLSYIELEDRLETLYAAKTYGELVEIAADLPNGPTAPTAVAGSASSAVTPVPQPGMTVHGPAIKVLLSETKRVGNWLVPQRQEINAVLGDVTLDYTEAHIPYDEIFIDVKSVLAEVKIRVPQNAIVHLDSNPILGSVSDQGESAIGPVTAAPTTPPKIFHIRGTAILADIKIKRGPRLSKRLGLT